MALTFDEARACVLREVGVSMGTESVTLAEASGRVLAEEVLADRDYPPFARSARDGFAVRAADLPGELRVIGEVRAGEMFSRSVASGEAVEIMTGAPLPEGADAVVMLEHTTREGDRVRIQRSAQPGDNFNPRGIEARSGDRCTFRRRPHRLRRSGDAGHRGAYPDCGLPPAKGCDHTDRR